MTDLPFATVTTFKAETQWRVKRLQTSPPNHLVSCREMLQTPDFVCVFTERKLLAGASATSPLPVILWLNGRGL